MWKLQHRESGIPKRGSRKGAELVNDVLVLSVPPPMAAPNSVHIKGLTYEGETAQIEALWRIFGCHPAESSAWIHMEKAIYSDQAHMHTHTVAINSVECQKNSWLCSHKLPQWEM